MKKILVVDGNSIINRAFYGLRLLQTAEGKYTNAIYGMINIISRQMDQLRPDYAAVAFDVKAPTFRHKMYDEYKAGRHATPPELLAQFPDAKACLTAMGLHVLEMPGWEADDIQGTVARMAQGQEDTHAYILTGDRDLLQLIDSKTTVVLVGNKETLHYHKEEFVEKYGITPEQYVDAKALMGDSSDHIPGVPGVGEKTAMKLISLCGSLEGVYHDLNQKESLPKDVQKVFSDGLCKKLNEGKDSAKLSYALAKICTEVPLEKTLTELSYEGVQNDDLYRLFISLEFHAFLAKFKLTPPSSAEKSEEGKWEESFSDDDFFAAQAPASNEEPTAEKSFIAPLESEVKTLCCEGVTALNLPEKLAIAFDSESLHFYAPNIGECKLLLENTQIPPSIFENKQLICYDSKALWHWLNRHSIPLGSTPFDVMLAAYLWRGGDGQIKTDALALPLLKCEPESYAHAPAAMLFALAAVLEDKLKQDGMLELAKDIEFPLAIVLAEMEQNGFMLNKDGMVAYSNELAEELEGLRLRICMQAGHDFNINSTKQLGQVLFEELGLPVQKKTKSGFSTDAETLEKLKDAHPIVADILDYRQISKLHSTYGVGLPLAADENGRIHTDFKQALTTTGRLSSAEPNLQNIPVRTKMGEKMRSYFITYPDYVLVDADYSQIELRLLAHLSGDEKMIEAFKSGADIHSETAASVFGVAREEVTSELRKRAKAVNFGIVYGMGAHSLSEDLHIPQKEAKAYIENYFATYPKIGQFFADTVEEATDKGYTTTLFGRRRYIPQLKATKALEKALGKRLAMNSPLQGTAADIMKKAMLLVHKRLKEELPEAKLVMQVHDELIVEAPKSKAELAAKIVKEEMEAAASLKLPLTADAGVGENWLAAKS